MVAGPKLPPLVSLRAFDAVARHMSVRKAAEELGVNHSAVSRHIKSLQAYLQVQLLQSSARGIVLTPAGRRYAAAIAPAFAAIADAATALNIEGKSNHLTIWCIPGFALRFLTPRLPAFHAAYPRIEIRLRPADQPADFTNGEIDAEIGFGVTRRSGTKSQILTEPRTYPVASPAFLAQHPAASLRDLPRIPLIHEESAQQWRQWLTAAGIEPPRHLAGPCLWHSHLAIEAARHGQGVALANDFLARDAVAAGELCEVGATNIRLAPYVFVARADRWNEPALAKFRSWLGAQVKNGPGPAAV
jgi:LysR family transcriptional regulator, glycine cleavage system transcriptional activator